MYHCSIEPNMEDPHRMNAIRPRIEAPLFVAILLSLSFGAAHGAEIGSTDPPFAEPRRAAIEAAFDRSFAGTKAPGAVVGVWIPGQGSYVAVRGVADVKTRQPMRVDDYFRVGSITKTITLSLKVLLGHSG